MRNIIKCIKSKNPKTCPILAFINKVIPVIAIAFMVGSFVYMDFERVYTFVSDMQFANIFNIF